MKYSGIFHNPGMMLESITTQFPIIVGLPCIKDIFKIYAGSVHFFADNNVRYKIIINGYYFSEIVSIDCSLNVIQRHLLFHSIIKFALSKPKIKIVRIYLWCDL